MAYNSLFQMKEQGTMISALQAYRNKDYISALKQFHSTRNTTSSNFQALSTQVLAAVTNLQLCNYNEAGQQLTSVYQAIAQMEQKEGVGLNIEMQVLKVKVLCNLMILELVSCGGKTLEFLEELVEIIRDCVDPDGGSGVALFRVIVKSLFGFESFAQMETQCEELLKRMGKKQPKSKSIQVAAQTPSAILLSSFSLYSHLAGNFKQAYLLEQASHEISKGKNPIASVLSLRHLQELAKELKDQKAGRQYRNQLIVAMSGQQLEGVAEETLFRNYSKKLQLASQVVGELMQRQQEWCRQQEKLGIEKYAVIWKLRNLQKQQKSDEVTTVLGLLQANGNIIQLMGGTSFVKQAKNQYTKSLRDLADKICRIGQRIYFRQLLERLYAEDSEGSFRNIPEQGSIESPVTSKQDLSFRSNASHKHKHPYATSFYLPKEDKSKEKDEQSSFSQINENPQGTSRSRLATNHFGNKVYMRNQPVKVEEERGNNVYKIARGDNKNILKKTEAKEGKIGKEIGRSKSRSKMEGDLISKQKKIQSGVRTGESIIGQFIKESTKPSENLPMRPQEQDQKFIPPEQVRKNNAIQQTLPKQSIAREIIPQEKGQFSEGTAGFNIIKQRQVQEQIPIVAKKHPVRRQYLNEAEHSQAVKFNPLKTTPLNPVSKQPLEARSRHITTLSELKLKHGEPLHRSVISREQLLSKLRRIISLCQSGQYIQKRHFSSDGGAQRFLMLSKARDKIFWGQSEEAIDISSSSCSYSIQDIKGIVYGKVTDTMRKQCNHKLDAWKCFSLILKKRTFDVYLPEERDLFFWLPGLSLCLKDLDYSSDRYQAQQKHPKREQMAANVVVFGDRRVERFYSVGRVLWKRFLIRIKSEYLVYKKHEKYRKFACPNAYAIVLAAVRTMGYKPQVIKKQIS